MGEHTTLNDILERVGDRCDGIIGRADFMRLVFLQRRIRDRKGKRGWGAHNNSGALHVVVSLPAEETADESAMDLVAVCISMHDFNKVGVRLASLPNGEGDKAVFPADARKGEATALFVVKPI
jgi:hypothetical protein